MMVHGQGYGQKTFWDIRETCSGAPESSTDNKNLKEQKPKIEKALSQRNLWA